MRQTFSYSEAQYQKSANETDGLTALEILGIDWQQIDEPFENVQQHIADNYHDGVLEVEIEMK